MAVCFMNWSMSIVARVVARNSVATFSEGGKEGVKEREGTQMKYRISVCVCVCVCVCLCRCTIKVV